MNTTPSVIHNDAKPAGHSLDVELTGAKSNRSAIGAVATVSFAGKKRTTTVMGGSSFYSQNAFALHFGLGSATRVDQLEVKWPSGAVQSWKGIEADRLVRAVEAREQLEQAAYQTPGSK
jgi:hypothetical protein